MLRKAPTFRSIFIWNREEKPSNENFHWNQTSLCYYITVPQIFHSKIRLVGIYYVIFLLCDSPCTFFTVSNEENKIHIDLSLTVIASSMTEMSIWFKLRRRLMVLLLEPISLVGSLLLYCNLFVVFVVSMYVCLDSIDSPLKTKRMKKWRWMKTETRLYNPQATWLKVCSYAGVGVSCDAKYLSLSFCSQKNKSKIIPVTEQPRTNFIVGKRQC